MWIKDFLTKNDTAKDPRGFGCPDNTEMTKIIKICDSKINKKWTKISMEPHYEGDEGFYFRYVFWCSI